jgi:glycosyltransferase involved in cell wall biosynthesis
MLKYLSVRCDHKQNLWTILNVSNLAPSAAYPMKVLMLSRYGRLGASSRLRTMQYLPFLAEAGLEVEVAPLFDDAYLSALYGGKRRATNMIRYYKNRIALLLARSNADVIWMEKEALPWMPWCLERLALPSGIPLITDHDDAIFHRYDMARNPVIRCVLGRKIDRVMAASTIVVAGNTYLADRAQKAGAKRVKIIPTVLDTQSYGVGDLATLNQKPVIGWIGSPSTWHDYAAPMIPLLSSVAETESAIIRAVGAAQGVASSPTLDIRPWSEATEVAAIQSMDIGIMPLADSPWARGKCGYKLIQYMACGLPVVASPVGVNVDIVEHGVNGFLATSEEEWREALTILLHDPDLRRRMGAAGRCKVEAKYSLEVWGPRVADMFREIAGERS